MALGRLKREKKYHFLQMRARNLIKLAFASLALNQNLKGHFRSRLHRFLRLRASSLLRRSFDALVTHASQKCVSNKLVRVARFIYLRRVLTSTYGKLKRHCLLSQGYRTVANHVQSAVLAKVLNTWKMHCLMSLIARRMLNRRAIKVEARCWATLKAKTKAWRRFRVASLNIIQKKNTRLAIRVISSLEAHAATCKRLRKLQFI